MNNCTGEEILKFLKKAKGKSANILDIARKLELDQEEVLENLCQLAQEKKVRHLGFGIYSSDLPPQKNTPPAVNDFVQNHAPEKNLIESDLVPNVTKKKSYKQLDFLEVPNGTKKTFDKVLEKTENLIESKKDVNCHSPDAINIYKAGNSEAKYYRYSYYLNRKINHVHVKGGNIHNALAQQRAQRLKEAIAQGKNHQEIIQIIKSW